MADRARRSPRTSRERGLRRAGHARFRSPKRGRGVAGSRRLDVVRSGRALDSSGRRRIRRGADGPDRRACCSSAAGVCSRGSGDARVVGQRARESRLRAAGVDVERARPAGGQAGRGGVGGRGLVRAAGSGAGAARPAERVGERDRRTRGGRLVMAVDRMGRAFAGAAASCVGWASALAGPRAAIAASPSATARRRRGDAVDLLWAAAFCRSATRASARARAMLWWYMAASSGCGGAVVEQPRARRQPAANGAPTGGHRRA